MVLTLITCSPRRTGLSGRRHSRIARELDSSVGESGPHAFASAPAAARLAAPSRPSHPAPNVRDDREAPLLRARDGTYRHIFGKKEREKFGRCRLSSGNGLKRLAKFLFWRR